MADLRQVVFSQTGHFYDGIAVNAVLEHGSCNFKGGFALAFFNAALFTELNPFSMPSVQAVVRWS